MIRIKMRHVLFFLITVVTGYYIIQSSTFLIFIQRFFVDRSTITGRVDGIKNIAGISFEQMLFGRGFAFESVVEEIGWIPGFALVFVYFGFAGLAVLSVNLLLIYRMMKNNLMGKGMFILFVIMNCTSYPLFSAFFVTYLFFILLTIVYYDSIDIQPIKNRVVYQDKEVRDSRFYVSKL